MQGWPVLTGGGVGVGVGVQAFQQLFDGSRGPELENIAVGDNVQMDLEEGRFLPGVAEALVGAKAGETRIAKVSRPQKGGMPRGSVRVKPRMVEGDTGRRGGGTSYFGIVREPGG
jgi:hypothetical protein